MTQAPSSVRRRSAVRHRAIATMCVVAAAALVTATAVWTIPAVALISASGVLLAAAAVAIWWPTRPEPQSQPAVNAAPVVDANAVAIQVMHSVTQHIRARIDGQAADPAAFPPCIADGVSYLDTLITQLEKSDTVALKDLANLSSRFMSRINFIMEFIDEFEQSIESKNILQGLWKIDHQILRLKQTALCIAVLSGVLQEYSSEGQSLLPLTDVLRGGIAQVDDYQRVSVRLEVDAKHVRSDDAELITLIASVLVDNATKYSAQGTPVMVRITPTSHGVAVEIEDAGLGMPDTDRHHYNRILRDCQPQDIINGMANGHVGIVAAAIAAQSLGINIELRKSIYHGTLAIVVISKEILVEPETAAADSPDTVPAPDPSDNTRQWQSASDPVPLVHLDAQVHPTAGSTSNNLPRRPKPQPSPDPIAEPHNLQAFDFDPTVMGDFLQGSGYDDNPATQG